MTNLEPVVLPPERPGAGALLFGLVVKIRSWVLRFAIGVGVAAAVIIYAILADGFPDGGNAVLAVIGLAAVVAPTVMLVAFWFTLGELARFPERLRNLPLEAREHGDQLRLLVERSRRSGESGFAIGHMLWHALRTTRAARDTLTPYAPLLPLVSVPFLVATALAALAGAVEIMAACVVATVLLT